MTETRHEGKGLLYLESHCLLPYSGDLVMTTGNSWSLTSRNLYVYSLRPWGEDWASPLIRQIYLEIMGGLDPLDVNGPTQGRPFPRRLPCLTVKPLEGNTELAYRGSAVVTEPAQYSQGQRCYILGLYPF